jgi:hypothetical protein
MLTNRIFSCASGKYELLANGDFFANSLIFAEKIISWRYNSLKTSYINLLPLSKSFLIMLTNRTANGAAGEYELPTHDNF